MQGPQRRFGVTLLAVWAAAVAGGAAYAHYWNVPLSVAAPVLAAFMWEASFYLVPGFPEVREAFERRWSPPALAFGLCLSAAAPYCAYTIPLGSFRWSALALLVALAALAAFWYVLLPPSRLWDLAFLAFMAVVVLGGAFGRLYPSPMPKLRLSILGQLMWTRMGVFAVLSFRGAEGIGFGFLPSRREWAAGLRHYCYFLPVGLPLGLATGLLRLEPPARPWWMTALLLAGTFLGILWVVALAEEFFFRGLLQQWLSEWLGTSVAGLLAASALFGLAHLSFRAFPNWRMALLAAVAGLFYGRAYNQTRGIRAPMVAHALVVTTARFLSL